MTLRNSSVTALMLPALRKTATYCARSVLFTPRNFRWEFRNPVPTFTVGVTHRRVPAGQLGQAVLTRIIQIIPNNEASGCV
jgi:hypothetical protein